MSVKKSLINADIKAREMLVISSSGESLGTFSRDKALSLAKERSMDLVQMSDSDTKCVCKLMNYSKYVYNQKKKKQVDKKKQNKVSVKTIKFRPNIAENDLLRKINQAKGMIENGDRVEVHLQFRGREMHNQDIGFTLFEKTKEEIEGVGKVDKESTEKGKRLWLMHLSKTKS